MDVLSRVRALTGRFWAPLAVALLLLVAALDVFTGNDLSFSLFYLLPLSLAAWYGGRGVAIAACTASVVVWLLADALSGRTDFQPLVYVWNAGIRFGFFVIVASLLLTLKEQLERETQLSRVDYVTGATAPGFFYDLLQAEIDRCNRHGRPFTLAYLDIDNFKAVNDRFGHSTGDELLRRVVNEARQGLRETDIVARLGGDELAILLPETSQAAAPAVMSRLMQMLLGDMKANRWPVTFSIGAMTFPAAPETSNAVIGMVDELMYSVKRAGKNSIRYAVYAGPAATGPGQRAGRAGRKSKQLSSTRHPSRG